NARSRLRSGRTKLAVARWAICTFERQGHLVGTVTGSPSGRPSQRSGLPILTHDELASSLDHLVGAGEQRLRDFEAERPGGLEVEDELEFGGELDRRSEGLAPLRMRSTKVAARHCMSIRSTP